MGILLDSLASYAETAKLNLVFGVMVLAVALFMLSFFTYVVAGAGFVRYADILVGKMALADAVVLTLVGLISIFSLSFLSVAVTSVVKLRRSLDDVGFFKLAARFPRFILRLMTAWVILALATFFIGLLFTALGLPSFFIVLLMLLLWAFFLFLPQSIVLKGYKFKAALRDSADYCFKRPLEVMFVYLATIVLLFVLVLVEVAIGQFGVFWLGPLVSAVILFLFVIPYLEIVKANLYLARYRLLLLGLK